MYASPMYFVDWHNISSLCLDDIICLLITLFPTIQFIKPFQPVLDVINKPIDPLTDITGRPQTLATLPDLLDKLSGGRGKPSVKQIQAFLQVCCSWKLWRALDVIRSSLSSNWEVCFWTKHRVDWKSSSFTYRIILLTSDIGALCRWMVLVRLVGGIIGAYVETTELVWRRQAFSLPQVIQLVGQVRDSLKLMNMKDDRMIIGSFVLAGTNKTQDYPIRCDNDIGVRRRRMYPDWPYADRLSLAPS